jgi:putative ABC transport system ATP-binding protein
MGKHSLKPFWRVKERTESALSAGGAAAGAETAPIVASSGFHAEAALDLPMIKLNEKDTGAEYDDPAPVKCPDEEYIQFKNVRKIYQMGEVEIEALAGVDFSIKKGEFVVIVGASGAGKSTILNILGGMDNLTSGTIFVDGQNISRYTKNQLIAYRRYDVGFVFQFYNLVQNLTAIENIELASQVSRKPLDINEVITDVGLANRKNNFPSQLSGGEQQRIAIARALAKNPKLLLCDEPTGALDYVTSKSILKLLQETCKKTGTTVIVISHNLALTAIGNRVIKVKSGKVDSITVNEKPADVERIEW